ncbi:rhodanese-like domain-containing protein [Immundisolibacter sp.]|uniref:rhodanese-like domain-containing protein n=1 Tax=Immundisolibacter sp. TaxID=1934948 RepID=UPI00263269FB|nr:rhodanese-like domain-containing protein [Immundisolibacter sp.]MDD3650679.1 rhodanese-like domain-containing protein [Immundisolibacter sp.]
MRELSVQALKAARDAGTAADWQLIDVREPWEHALCALPGAVLMPMRGLPQRLRELDPARTTVVLCHHGVRSHQVAVWLERNGFKDVVNLRGGMDAWAREIEPEMAVY